MTIQYVYIQNPRAGKYRFREIKFPFRGGVSLYTSVSAPSPDAMVLWVERLRCQVNPLIHIKISTYDKVREGG